MDCVSKWARAARSKLCKVQIMFKQISEVTWVYALTFDQFVKIAPLPCKSFQNILYSPNRFFVLFALKQLCTLLFRLSSFLPWHNLPRAARKFFQCIPRNYFLFLWIAAEEGRARSAETFSIYNSLSYGLRKKGRAQRGKFLKLDIIFLKLA